MSQSEQIIYDETIKLFLEELGVRFKRGFSSNIDLFKDLGIDGDDAHELIDEFRDRYGVDVSRLQFERHFGSEGLNPFALLTLRAWHRQRIPVRIKDLVDSARSGYWTIEYE